MHSLPSFCRGRLCGSLPLPPMYHWSTSQVILFPPNISSQHESSEAVFCETHIFTPPVYCSLRTFLLCTFFVLKISAQYEWTFGSLPMLTSHCFARGSNFRNSFHPREIMFCVNHIHRVSLSFLPPGKILQSMKIHHMFMIPI